MNILSLFGFSNKSSADTARDRLKSAISLQRNAFLPKLQSDIIKVLKKYIANIDERQVNIRIDRQKQLSTIEFNATFPTTAFQISSSAAS